MSTTAVIVSSYIASQQAAAHQAAVLRECVANLHPQTVNPVNICLNLQELFDPTPSNEWIWLGRFAVIFFFGGLLFSVYKMWGTEYHDYFEWAFLPILSAISAAFIPVGFYGLFCAIRYFFF